MATKCDKCGTSNSDNAKFCNNCGAVLPLKQTQQQESKTMDSFNNIPWESIKKYKQGMAKTCYVISAISVLSLFIKCLMYFEVFLVLVYPSYLLIPALLIIISILFSGLFVKGLQNKLRSNADFIEKNQSYLVIINKNNVFGLFNKSKAKVILPAMYNNITRISGNTFILENNGKYSLYHKDKFILTDDTKNRVKDLASYYSTMSSKQISVINIPFIISIIISAYVIATSIVWIVDHFAFFFR